MRIESIYLCARPTNESARRSACIKNVRTARVLTNLLSVVPRLEADELAGTAERSKTLGVAQGADEAVLRLGTAAAKVQSVLDTRNALVVLAVVVEVAPQVQTLPQSELLLWKEKRRAIERVVRVDRLISIASIAVVAAAHTVKVVE